MSRQVNLQTERQSSDAAGESRRRKRELDGRENHDSSDLPFDWFCDFSKTLLSENLQQTNWLFRW